MMFQQPDREYFVRISNSGTIKFIQAPVIQRVDSNIYWINPCSLPKLPCIPMFPHFSVVCSLINISSYHLPPPSRSTFNCSGVAKLFPYDISPLFRYSSKPLRDPHEFYKWKTLNGSELQLPAASCFLSLRSKMDILRYFLFSSIIYIPTFKIFLVFAKSFLDACASVFDSSFTVFFATFLSGEDGNVNSSFVVLAPIPRFVLSWSSDFKGWIVAISTWEWLLRLFMWRVGSSFFINPWLMVGPALWERRSQLATQWDNHANVWKAPLEQLTFLDDVCFVTLIFALHLIMWSCFGNELTEFEFGWLKF